MKKLVLTSMIASIGVIGFNAQAQVTSNFQSTASVTAKCVVSSDDINFGNLDLFSPSVIEANGIIKVLCSNNVNYSVTPDMGWNNGRVQAIHNQDNNGEIAVVVTMDKTAGGAWDRSNAFIAIGNGQEQSHAITAKYRSGDQSKTYMPYLDNQYNYQATPGEYSGGVNVIITY